MTDQILKDPRGHVIARIVTGTNGVQTIKDPRGHTLGSYDPRSNKTRDPRGYVVGEGNLLASLIR